jgi:DNA-binding NtrC family response regulator
MREKDNNLKSKLGILESLSSCEEIDNQIFQRKLEVLKDVAMILVNEISALEYVRSVNISKGINLHEEMRMFEVHLIQSALERTGGHQTRAAQLLGINLTTLHNKLKRLNISPDNLVNAPIIHEDSLFKPHPSEESLSHLRDEQFSPLVA